MARMIDADALLRKICGMSCGCEPDQCGFIDEYKHERCKAGQYVADAPTVDAIPVDWLERRLNETTEATAQGDDQTELNNALFQVLVEWEKGRRQSELPNFEGCGN